MLIEFLAMVGKGLLALLAVWVVVRVAATAFFKSKQDIERTKNGTQQNP